MHQIPIQQLCLQIPRCVSQWSPQDICTWLTLNEIQIDMQRILGDGVTGARARKMVPNQWMNGYGCTRFIAKQIVEWLDEDAEEFDDLVKNNAEQIGAENCKAEIIPCEEVQATPKVQSKNQNKIQPVQRKFKSSENLQECQNQSSQQYQSEKPKEMHRKESIEQSLSGYRSEQDESSDQFQAFSEGIISEEEKDQCAVEDIQKVQEVTDREQKKKLIQAEIKKFQPQQQNKLRTKPIVDISQNESMNVAKWIKKKKDDSKASNQRAKQRIKQRNPKLYNYINANLTEPNESLRINKGLQKKINSVQDIPNPKRMNNYIDQKPKNEPIQTPLQFTPSDPSKMDPLKNPQVKFVSSQFIPYISQSQIRVQKAQKFLKITTPNIEHIVTGFAKIGRAASNDIVLADESVSRSHAEIIVSTLMNGSHKFGLKDVGSKFGTFVECRGVQEDIEGKSYLIGDAQIEIVSIEINKHNLIPNNASKKPTFDLRYKVDRQKQTIIVNRASVTIGNGNKNDIQIESNCVNGRIWLDRGKKPCLEAIDGRIYSKLKEHQMVDIESYLDGRKKMEFVFGWLKAGFELVENCAICGNRVEECACISNVAPKKALKY